MSSLRVKKSVLEEIFRPDRRMLFQTSKTLRRDRAPPGYLSTRLVPELGSVL